MPNLSVQPNDRITYKVHYEDEHLALVGKPPGVVTLPGLGHEHDTLLNGLFARWGAQLQNLGRKRDFGLLHRLDRETSGLVIIALRAPAYDRLREDFEARRIQKYYWAVVKGAPREPSAVIRRPLIEVQAKVRGRSQKVSRVSAAGKPGITAYRLLQQGPAASLLECRAVTGRLHQLRVHLDLIGCPILGDDLYAESSLDTAAPRLALHAHRVVLSHPITGERLDVRTPWPSDLRGLLKRLGLSRPDLAPSGVEGKREIKDDAVGDEDA